MILNPAIWYAERELTLIPPHFVKCPTPVTTDSLDWIRNKTIGRFVLGPIDTDKSSPIRGISLSMRDYNKYYVYFESTSDATLYELYWSGSD